MMMSSSCQKNFIKLWACIFRSVKNSWWFLNEKFRITSVRSAGQRNNRQKPWGMMEYDIGVWWCVGQSITTGPHHVYGRVSSCPYKKTTILINCTIVAPGLSWANSNLLANVGYATIYVDDQHSSTFVSMHIPNNRKMKQGVGKPGFPYSLQILNKKLPLPLPDNQNSIRRNVIHHLPQIPLPSLPHRSAKLYTKRTYLYSQPSPKLSPRPKII